ncbi:MAG: diacylglycerol kinase family lipid kinase [Gammaproteobacteria bacterium]
MPRSEEPSREWPDLPLLINPVAGRGTGRHHADSMRRYLEHSGRRVWSRFSTGPGHITTLVREAAATASPEVVVAGGDGTVREAVNAILGEDLPLALGIVPIGTGNDFVKSLGTPRHWRNACRALTIGIAEGRRRRIDAGQCNDTWFANSVGVGLDAVVTLAAERMRWMPRALAYPAALTSVVARGVDAADMRIELDGRTVSQRTSTVIACNGAWIGGRFRIAPDARIDDGLLSVLIAAPLSRSRILTLIPRVIRGTHVSAPEATLLTGRELLIDGTRSMPLQADGEIMPEAPERLVIRCLPAALSVIA